MATYPLGRSLRLACVLTAALLPVGCHLRPFASAEDQRRSLWREGRPVEYSFILDSGCGERSLIGRFAVTVRSNRVSDVEALDESARSVLAQGSASIVPTLERLLTELDHARSHGADVAEATFDPGDGHLVAIDIDHEVNATDDEACYRISHYVAEVVG